MPRDYINYLHLITQTSPLRCCHLPQNRHLLAQRQGDGICWCSLAVWLAWNSFPTPGTGEKSKLPLGVYIHCNSSCTAQAAERRRDCAHGRSTHLLPEGKGLGGDIGSTARPPTKVRSSARSWVDDNCHLALKPMVTTWISGGVGAAMPSTVPTEFL